MHISNHIKFKTYQEIGRVYWGMLVVGRPKYRKRKQNYIQKMYTMQSPSSNNHQPLSNPYHCRTPSHSRLVPNSPMLEHRPPSQKKLSITCTMKNPNEKEGLRKRSGEVSQMKGKFVSMHTSFMSEATKDTKDGHDVDGQMKEYVQIVGQKLEVLRNSYLMSMGEMSVKIEELQTKLAVNQRELRRKSGQIEQLEILCRNQQNKLAQLAHPQQLQAKIDDLSIQLRVMGEHCSEMQEEQSQKYDQLTTQTIAYFGNKLANLRKKSNDFVRNGLITLQLAEEKLTQLMAEREKVCSEGTRGSMQSVGESILNLTQSEQPDQGISFQDDCFFHPPSENCELITQMAKRRGEALRCWIDKFNYLRYCDSSSYVYNRKGDRVKLTIQELGLLLEQNLLTL